ncbi:MAG: CopG family transcriptional regulator [Corynebacterium sp.]|nr:CopG family transcriptional regulator [Corynebacterium sp.]
MAMTLRLSAAEDQILNFLAESQGVSKQQAVINAIVEAATKRSHDATIVEAARQLLPEFAAMEKRVQRGF